MSAKAFLDTNIIIYGRLYSEDLQDRQQIENQLTIINPFINF